MVFILRPECYEFKSSIDLRDLTKGPSAPTASSPLEQPESLHILESGVKNHIISKGNSLSQGSEPPGLPTNSGPRGLWNRPPSSPPKKPNKNKNRPERQLSSLGAAISGWKHGHLVHLLWVSQWLAQSTWMGGRSASRSRGRSGRWWHVAGGGSDFFHCPE